MGTCARTRSNDAGPSTDAPRKGVAGSMCVTCVHARQAGHSLCGTGLCGPSKCFLDLRLQVRFSGDARGSRDRKICALYRKSSGVFCFICSAALLQAHSRRIMFNPQVLTSAGWLVQTLLERPAVVGEPTALHNHLL